DLADPIDAEPVGERHGRSEHRSPDEPGHHADGDARPEGDRTSLARDDPGSGDRVRGDQGGRDDQQPAEGDLLPHQGQIGELRVQPDEGYEDRPDARDQSRPDDRPRGHGTHQTFSASLDPRSPPGRKIRTSTSTRKVKASFNWNEEGMPYPVRMSAGPTDCRSPSRTPPNAAPEMLPIPPRTAAVKAAIP